MTWESKISLTDCHYKRCINCAAINLMTSFFNVPSKEIKRCNKFWLVFGKFIWIKWKKKKRSKVQSLDSIDNEKKKIILIKWCHAHAKSTKDTVKRIYIISSPLIMPISVFISNRFTAFDQEIIFFFFKQHLLLRSFSASNDDKWIDF